MKRNTLSSLILLLIITLFMSLVSSCGRVIEDAPMYNNVQYSSFLLMSNNSQVIHGELKRKQKFSYVIKHREQDRLPIPGEFGILVMEDGNPIPVKFTSITGNISICHKMPIEPENIDDKTWIIRTTSTDIDEKLVKQ